MILLMLAACPSDPDAPPTIAWDRQACEHCGMLVSEPHHAAALVTRDGRVLAFDDPGCLFRYMVAETPAVSRMWFHDSAGEGWFREHTVAFSTGGRTPMGSGLLAVPSGTPGALTVGEASGRALERR